MQVLADLLPLILESLPFMLGVLLVAVCTWGLRSFVESDPDPFFLNLTFFAIGGLGIRFIECFTERGNIDRSYAFYLIIALLVGVAVVLTQVFVMKAHMRETQEHYEESLKQHKTDGCQDGEVQQWAAVLLLITRTDFSPGSYRTLPFVNTDPRRKSKEQAISVLPRTHFMIGGTGLTVDALIVPRATREPLWHWYVVLCYLSWALFFIAMVISQRVVTTPQS